MTGHNSGLIRLVIDVDVDDGLDMSSVVAMAASVERPGKDQLCDADWFHEDVSQCGLDYLLGLKDWDDLKSGLWVVEGYLWGEHLHTVDGEDYDGGFEVEKAELLDVEKLIPDWLMAGSEEANLAYLFHAQLNSENEFMRKGAFERLNTLKEILSLLGTIYEDKCLRFRRSEPSDAILFETLIEWFKEEKDKEPGDQTP